MIFDIFLLQPQIDVWNAGHTTPGMWCVRAHHTDPHGSVLRLTDCAEAGDCTKPKGWCIQAWEVAAQGLGVVADVWQWEVAAQGLGIVADVWQWEVAAQGLGVVADVWQWEVAAQGLGVVVDVWQPVSSR